jgi:hypothetical protein
VRRKRTGTSCTTGLSPRNGKKGSGPRRIAATKRSGATSSRQSGQRSERLPQAGLRLQADGSRHRWLGPAGSYLTLLGGLDDASGTVPHARFREQDDAAGCLGGGRGSC